MIAVLHTFGGSIIQRIDAQQSAVEKTAAALGGGWLELTPAQAAIPDLERLYRIVGGEMLLIEDEA